MSYSYPQDRHRDRKEKGDQPYEDARETYAENEAEIERTAPEGPDRGAPRSDEHQAHDAEQRFEQIGDAVARERDDGDGS
jgi:hypothetical protein